MTRVRVRSEGIAWQEVDNDLIVLDERNSLYMRLIGSATLLWPLLVDGVTEDELAAALVEAFGLDTAQARIDVATFLHGLRAQDLLETAA
ncbi:PqqD family protein [uncultured Jatrophihabitans sp.]|uniref:PqqD family protein n=1 Tax=uncultured Jatrophihabitans sp. TaxID=1610747 RepID=UPI0035C98161